MNGDAIALAIGTLLAVGALAVVLQPLFFGVRSEPRSVRAAGRHADDSAIVALREIEFDRATGKLSEADYAELKAEYTPRALEELRMREVPIARDIDPIEARVRAYRETHRECATCGLRPESHAVYCSACGAYLDRECAECGAEIIEQGAAFCSNCGASLSPAAPQNAPV